MSYDERAALRKLHSDFIAYECIVHGGHKDNKNSGCYRSGHRDFLEFVTDGFPHLLDELDSYEQKICKLEETLASSRKGDNNTN